MPAIPGDIKTGDLVGFSGACLASDLINLATYGLPRRGVSHVGIIARSYGRKLLLFESTTLGDLECEILKRPVSGVQAHSLEEVVNAYKGRVWLYPLYRSLYSFESWRLSIFLLSKIGTPYDESGAVRSGGLGLLGTLCGQDLTSIFCSEMLAAAYANIGILPTGNASRWNPNRLVRTLRSGGVICKPRRLK